MLSPEQSRAARAWLEWSQAEFASKANVSQSTVRDFERRRRVPIKNNLEAMRLALEMAGVSLMFRGDMPVGVQITKPSTGGN